MIPDTLPTYPLSAVAHQPELLLALSLLAVAPSVGGLLIRGDRGAAKSTAARGLAALLPQHDNHPAPFVNLPLGATEDRVVGTLDLNAALRGEARLKSGLMAQAHGGLLYIDEVNLLPDHLVDVLLDAAALGVVRVERDGLSASSRADFALVGSMNPEEGGLRPQFLDRFGLCVDVQAPTDAQQRAEIVRRRMRFETDAQGFTEQWQAGEVRLRERLQAARLLFPSVDLPDALLGHIAALSAAAQVRSLRADLVMHRAARAFAALEGRSEVSAADIERVAPLVLLHRRDPRLPPPPPQQATPPPDSAPPQEPPSPLEQQPDQSPPPSDFNPQAEEVFAPTANAAPLPALVGKGAASSGSSQGDQPGRVIRSVPVSSQPDAPLHLPDTLRAALGRNLGGEFQLTAGDLRRAIHEPVGERRVLFVVDASGSMGVAGRMGALKGALLGVLSDKARRDRAALIVFRGTGATLALPWTMDAAEAEAVIAAVPTGGRTPLAHALQLAAEIIHANSNGAQSNTELVIFTDGRANVPLTAGRDAWTDALHAAQALRDISALIVDTETGRIKLGRAAQLAEVLGARYSVLETV
ncbi:VWA domain-containing protein [Deinococcus arenicola]|uniref:VWA domain-containing protein n=1 Tax=Deinococcus arenicola TaxID=2994950 RepID=A0ABU4DTH2_9DEIO|nr:VWA domain-containing protein [Deinococcus sp. ZS9-10]MDV6375743.1 VWA domain-containing protein [Deinococcus sp. ZS9-10]